MLLSNWELLRRAPSMLHNCWLPAILVYATINIIPAACRNVLLELFIATAPEAHAATTLFWYLGTFFVLFSLFLAPPLQVGVSRYFLRLFRQECPSYWTVFSGFQQYFASLLLAWLSGFGLCVGFSLFFIPGVVLAAPLSMGAMVLADEPSSGAIQALRRSWELVWKQQQMLKVLCFLLLQGLVAIATCLSGMIVYEIVAFPVLGQYHPAISGVLQNILWLGVGPVLWVAWAALFAELQFASYKQENPFPLEQDMENHDPLKDMYREIPLTPIRDSPI